MIVMTSFDVGICYGRSVVCVLAVMNLLSPECFNGAGSPEVEKGDISRHDVCTSKSAFVLNITLGNGVNLYFFCKNEKYKTYF